MCIAPSPKQAGKNGVLRQDEDIRSPLTFSPDRKIIYAGTEAGSVIALKRRDTVEAMLGEKSGEAGKIEDKDG